MRKRIQIDGEFESDETGLEPAGTVEALQRLGIYDINISVEDMVH